MCVAWALSALAKVILAKMCSSGAPGYSKP
jgi:hypothetical protein